MSKKSNLKTTKIGIATTVKAAMAMTHLPIGAIKSAQAAGSKAFKANGRIDCDMLMDDVAQLPAVATTQGVDYFTEKALAMRAERMLRESKLRERERDLLPRAEVERVIRTTIIAAKMKFYQAEDTIPVEAGMKLALTDEQRIKLRQIIHAHHLRALTELFRNELGPIICPLCKGELKNEK
jgi:hypothetical protein